MSNFVKKCPTPMPHKDAYGEREFSNDLEKLKSKASNLTSIYYRAQVQNRKQKVPADSIAVKKKEYDELRNSIVEKIRKGTETSSKEEQDKLINIVKWIDGRSPTEFLDNLPYIENILQDLSKESSGR